MFAQVNPHENNKKGIYLTLFQAGGVLLGSPCFFSMIAL